MLPPALFPASLEMAGPKHSTNVSSSAGVPVPLSVDEKKVAFVPNPVPDLVVKTPPTPHVDEAPGVLCARVHSLPTPALQMVIPLMSPVTVHLKMKVSPGQVGGAAVNCPVTLPGIKVHGKHLPPPWVHNWMFDSVFHDLALYNEV